MGSANEVERVVNLSVAELLLGGEVARDAQLYGRMVAVGVVNKHSRERLAVGLGRPSAGVYASEGKRLALVCERGSSHRHKVTLCRAAVERDDRLVLRLAPVRSHRATCGVNHLKQRRTLAVSLVDVLVYRYRVTVFEEADGESRTKHCHC